MAESKVIGIRATKEDRELWEAAAEKEGKSLPALIKECVQLRLGFSDYFWDRLKNYSEALRVPPSLVLENMMIARVVQMSAEKIVCGLDAQPLNEFVFTENGPVSGQYLERMLMLDAVKIEVRKFTQALIDDVRTAKDDLGKVNRINNVRRKNKELEEMISRIGDYKKDREIGKYITDAIKFFGEELTRIGAK